MDIIPNSLLKHHVDVFAPIIADLKNLLFSMGRFSLAFKVAEVSPKKKNIDESDPAIKLIKFTLNLYFNQIKN